MIHGRVSYIDSRISSSSDGCGDIKFRANMLLMRWRYSTMAYFLVGHCNDVIMGAMASQITSLTIVHSTVYTRRRSKKHQNSTSLMNSPQKWPVTRNMFPFDDVIVPVIMLSVHKLNTLLDPYLWATRSPFMTKGYYETSIHWVRQTVIFTSDIPYTIMHQLVFYGRFTICLTRNNYWDP